MKKKLFALGAISTIGATLVSGIPVHAATSTGDATVKYTPGTVGPIDPIDPTNPADPNNWMVSYPKTVVLTNNNKLTDSDKGSTESMKNYEREFETKGQKLKFEVKRRLPVGGDSNVTAGNIGKGIKITATAADSNTWQAQSKVINMEDTASKTSVKMAIGSNTGDKADAENATVGESQLINKDEVVTTLKDNQKTKNGYAVIVDSQNELDGANYTAKITFQFAKVQ